MENGKIECVRTPKTPEPIDTKFGRVIMSAISPGMPKMQTIAQVGASGHMGEISLLRGFNFLQPEIFAHAWDQNHTTDFHAV